MKNKFLTPSEIRELKKERTKIENQIYKLKSRGLTIWRKLILNQIKIDLKDCDQPPFHLRPLDQIMSEIEESTSK